MPSESSPNGNPRSGSDSGTGDNSQEKKSWAQLGNYAHLAVALPLATIIGWAIGVGFDHWLHTTWLYIVGLILGIVAGFVELLRTVTKTQ